MLALLLTGGTFLDFPNRKRNRLAGYDYSTPGVYFITLCTHQKKPILSRIIKVGHELPISKLTEIGKVVYAEICNITTHYQNVSVDSFVIMPNHIHLLLRITERINPSPTIRYDIPNVIGKFKAAETRSVGKAFMPSVPKPLWQSSFHDHIVRGEQDYKKILEYIENNPTKWALDCLFCE